jgi:hypothetical protein
MVIRSEQMNQMRQLLVGRFENRVIEHLRRCFPRKCAARTESGVREEIRHGIHKARGYGFETELEICKYINLMFLLGRDFDVKSEPWASVCKQAGDRRAFYQKWDEAYDHLLASNRAANS